MFFCRITFFWDRTLRALLRKTFTAPQQIDKLRCQNFDTIKKSSDVSVGNCDHLLEDKPLKISSQSPRSNPTSEIGRGFLTVFPEEGGHSYYNRNVGRFLDGVKILASVDLLWCSERFLKHPVHKEYGSKRK